jgi:hypothetical protein
MSENYIFREAKIPMPTEKQKAGQQWVAWGEDNLYPQFLVGLYYNSSIHQGIVNSKVKYISSNGLDAKTTDVAKWDLIKKNGNAPFSLDEISAMICKDFELLDSFAIMFKKNIISKFWDMHHISAELIRKGETSEYFYYSENWKERNQTEEKTGFKKIKNIEDVTDQDNECILYVSSRSKQHIVDEKTGMLTKSVYPIPSYSGCINSIMASIEMNYFRYSEVVNSFKGGTMINIPTGAPENEHDRKKLVNQLKGESTDRDKQGGIIVTFSRGSENAPTVTQIGGNNLDQRYLLTQESIIDDIMVGHSVISPSLFSIKTAGQLGGSSELETAYALFMSNYASERQKIISDAIAYAQYTLNSFVGEVFFVEKPLQLGNVPDSKSIVADSLNKMSPLLANAVLKNLTINEQRALAGLTPLPNGDVLETTQATFNAQMSDEDVISWFAQCGRSEYKEVFSREINDFSDLERTEKELLSKHTFADNLTDLQTKILAMINNGESYGAIVKASGESATIVTRNLIELEKLGMIKGFELTPKGQQNTKGVKFEIVYQYRERTDAPKLKEGGSSRPFCTSLINLKKVFTREEIDGITSKLRSSGIDRDVWQYKGGWYTNPNTNVHTPSCRHTWFQIVINQ